MNHRVKTLLLAGIGILALLFLVSHLNIQSVSEYQIESREIAAQLEPEAVVSGFGGERATTSPAPSVLASGKKPKQKYLDKKKTTESKRTAAPKPSVTPAKHFEGGSNKKKTTKKSTPVTPAPSPVKKGGDTIYCTLEIFCDSSAEIREKIDKSKWEYVPDDGIILARTKAKVKKGTDVYQFLCQLCRAEGIALDSEYTPMYGSYYVRGIGHLYEMDAGDKSGWLYMVNGKKPDVGASSFTLSDGDTVVWRYTCDEKA